MSSRPVRANKDSIFSARSFHAFDSSDLEALVCFHIFQFQALDLGSVLIESPGMLKPKLFQMILEDSFLDLN
jgi:hypothetical protein